MRLSPLATLARDELEDQRNDLIDLGEVVERCALVLGLIYPLHAQEEDWKPRRRQA